MSRTIFKIIIPLLCILCICACGKEHQYIEGNITNLPDGMVYLRTWEDNSQVVDSTRSADGLFSMKIPDILPNVLFLHFEQYPELYLPVIIDGENISVKGNFSYNNDITISGTKSNDLYTAFREGVYNHNIMIATINRELSSYSDSTEIMDSVKYYTLNSNRDSISRLVVGSRKLFVETNPDCIVSAMFVVGSLTDSTTIFQVDSMLSKLDNTMRDNAFLRHIIKRRGELSK